MIGTVANVLVYPDLLRSPLVEACIYALELRFQPNQAQESENSNREFR